MQKNYSHALFEYLISLKKTLSFQHQIYVEVDFIFLGILASIFSTPSIFITWVITKNRPRQKKQKNFRWKFWQWHCIIAYEYTNTHISVFQNIWEHKIWNKIRKKTTKINHHRSRERARNCLLIKISDWSYKNCLFHHQLLLYMSMLITINKSVNND